MKLLVIALITSFGIVQYSGNWIMQHQKQRKQIFIAPPQYIKHLHFGYAEVMADSLWIRTIQDFDYCGKAKAPEVLSEEDILAESSREKKEILQKEFHHLLKEITSLNKNVSGCANGWVYQMLDSITELAPKFRMAYVMGATSLSVLLNDYEGASKLFEKAIRRFPGDWRLPYFAAYHYMYDRQDLAKAAELLEKSATLGAPPWVNSLASRAYTASGQGELAIRTLLRFREFTKDDMKAEVDERIRRIQQALIEEKQKKPSAKGTH